MKGQSEFRQLGKRVPGTQVCSSSCRIPPTLPKRIKKLDDIEKLAETLRDEWELGTGPINNLTELLEGKGIKVGLIEGLDDFDSCIILQKETWPIMVTRKDLPGDRQRFNLAHERTLNNRG